jgi:hypothetical protein
MPKNNLHIKKDCISEILRKHFFNIIRAVKTYKVRFFAPLDTIVDEHNVTDKVITMTILTLNEEHTLVSDIIIIVHFLSTSNP